MADAVVGPAEPGLEIAEDPMHAREELRRPGRGALDSGAMPVAQVGEGEIPRPAIRPDDRAPLDLGGDEAGQRPARGVRDHLQPDPARRPAADLHRGDDQSLGEPLTPTPQPGFRAADIRFIHLDRRLQGLAVRADRGAAQLLKHRPGGLVAVDPQLALELHGRHARGVGRHQIRRPEPERQRGPGPMEHRPGRDRGLAPTGPALPEVPRAELVGLGALTAGTSIAFRPTARGQVRPAGRLAPEAGLELRQRPGEVGSRHTRHYPWGPSESTG